MKQRNRDQLNSGFDCYTVVVVGDLNCQRYIGTEKSVPSSLTIKVSPSKETSEMADTSKLDKSPVSVAQTIK